LLSCHGVLLQHTEMNTPIDHSTTLTTVHVVMGFVLFDDGAFDGEGLGGDLVDLDLGRFE
jgi:hypothetical protein